MALSKGNSKGTSKASTARVKGNTGAGSGLKANNAGYSTTNRFGQTTYYKSAKDSAGYSDTANGKNVPTSTGNPMFTKDASGNVITSDSLKKAPTLNLPTPPAPIDPGNIVGANNAGLATGSGGLYSYDSKSGQLVTTPPAQDSAQTTFQQMLNANMQAYTDSGVGDSANRWAQIEKDTKLKKIEQQRNDYAAQINAITSKAQADTLSLEGQGRGVTEAIIGGQQAQINREAAIKALPIQAQLAAAQDNLEMAQAHADRLFQLQTQDAQAQYQFKTSLIKSVYDFANAQEQRILAANQRKEDRAYDMQKTNLSLQNDWAKTAIEYGQSSVAGRIMALDPKSETFQADLGALQARVSKPFSATKRDTQFDSNGNLIDMQTGEVLRSNSGSGSTTISGKPQTEGQAKANGFADRLLEAERTLQNSNKFGSIFAIGGILPNVAKSEDRQKFEQSRRNFINAVLRRESGAVISPEEFKNAEQQYFPQQGDSDGVLSQKASNRNTVINNFYREAGVLRPVSAGDIVESGGQRYKVAEDGVTLNPI